MTDAELKLDKIIIVNKQYLGVVASTVGGWALAQPFHYPISDPSDEVIGCFSFDEPLEKQI